MELDLNEGRIDWYKLALRRKGTDDAFLPEESGGAVPPAADGSTKYGYLNKEGHVRKTWKRRCVLITDQL